MSAKEAAGTVQSWHCSVDLENAIRLRQRTGLLGRVAPRKNRETEGGALAFFSQTRERERERSDE